ncbi:MAG: c-type cytochrome [Magnetococcales bacterium]|nr:c-type cytochrome [Magnetococcales bacterium]
MIKITAVLLLVLLHPSAVMAQGAEDEDVDLYNGRDINGVCAACHGELGQGSKNGEYPRLAGQIRSILLRQLYSFRDRKRINLPMIPYTDPRELSDEDILDVASYLSSLRIDVTIPYVEGDVAAGKKFFASECGSCHGAEGRGKEREGESEKFGPALTGQYPLYLTRQIANFKTGKRHHEEMEETARDLTEEELTNILAYLVTLERHPGLAEEVAQETQKRFKSILGSLNQTIEAPIPEEKPLAPPPLE